MVTLHKSKDYIEIDDDTTMKTINNKDEKQYQSQQQMVTLHKSKDYIEIDDDTIIKQTKKAIPKVTTSK